MGKREKKEVSAKTWIESVSGGSPITLSDHQRRG